jgi:hypothetical protein
MPGFIKNIFGGKDPEPEISNEDFNHHYEQKSKALVNILGPMHDLVGHAVIPYQVGGNVDMYYFPNFIDGTAFVTMELIQPDGSGPKPSSIGTYELIAFTKHDVCFDQYQVVKHESQNKFQEIERRLCAIFTVLGRYSNEAILNPKETVEIPISKDKPYRCLVLDNFEMSTKDFTIGGQIHGLLLVIEIFRSEMEYAMKNGTNALLDLLRDHGLYPYSDLDRDPVV